MDDNEFVKNMMAPKPKRKKTIKQLHNEIFIKKTKKY